MKKYHVDLTGLERVRLAQIIQKRTGQSEIVKRAYILQAADRGGLESLTDAVISVRYGVNVRTIERLRERFVEDGLEIALEIALEGKPREYHPSIKFDGAVEAQLVALRCQEPEVGRSGWTLELLGDKLVQLGVVESISRESVRQLLKKTQLSHGG